MYTEEARLQFREWLKELCRWGKLDQFVNWKEEIYTTERYLGICKIYTHNYKYQIKAHVTRDDSTKHGKRFYLGCQVSTRMPRAGEDWTRGNDLPDGPFTKETWQSIKEAIIKYELVKIAKLIRQKGVPETIEGPSSDDTKGDAKGEL